MNAVLPADAKAYEAQHVQAVYDDIASHFAQTRYKPWPIVADFLRRIPVGWVGVDVGCGNGKYLGSGNVTTTKTPTTICDPNDADPATSQNVVVDEQPLFFLCGLDLSTPLLLQAPPQCERLHSDASHPLPFRRGTVDFIISIATIHHFSTHERRRWAVQVLIEALFTPPTSNHTVMEGQKTKKRLLIYVWALEQGPKSKRKWEKGTLLSALPISNTQSPDCLETSTALDQEDVDDRHIKIQDVFVPWTTKSGDEFKTLNRYYHLFKQGELLQLVVDACQAMTIDFNLQANDDRESFNVMNPSVSLVAQGYEADNWWIELAIG